MFVNLLQRNMNASLLKLFSFTGIIPTTKFQMYVANVITGIFVSLAVASISARDYLTGMT